MREAPRPAPRGFSISKAKALGSKTGRYVDRVAFFQRHIGLFHVFPLAQLAAEAFDLAFGDGGVDRLHLDAEQLFHSFLDLRLGAGVGRLPCSAR